MDARIIDHLNKFKIDDTARLFIMAKLGVSAEYPDKEWVETLLRHAPKNISIHCAALCLYTNLIVTQTLMFNTHNLKPSYVGSLEDAKNMIKQKSKYQNLTDEEIAARVEEINLLDVRNCFAHGSFTFACPNSNPKNGFFILNPTHSEITCPHQIVVKFEAVYNAVWDYITLETLKYKHSTNFLEKAQQDMGKYIDEYIVPTSLQALVDNYFHPNHPLAMKKTLSSPLFQTHVQNTLSSAMFALNQNDFYELFGADSEIFGLVKVFRNSWIHNYTHTTRDGKEQVLDDPKNSQLPEAIKDDKYSLSKIMELLHAEKLIFKSQLDAGGITKEELKDMSVTDAYNRVFNAINKLTDGASANENVEIEK